MRNTVRRPTGLPSRAVYSRLLTSKYRLLESYMAEAVLQGGRGRLRHMVMDERPRLKGERFSKEAVCRGAVPFSNVRPTRWTPRRFKRWHVCASSDSNKPRMLSVPHVDLFA